MENNESKKSNGNGRLTDSGKSSEFRNQALDLCLLYLKGDIELMDELTGLLKDVRAHLKANPSAWDSGGTDIAMLLETMKAKAANPNDKDISGADIVGSGILDGLNEFIRNLGGIVEAEKRFFYDLIKLFLCGCDGKGW
ncbi:MAG: hypothetical protein Q7T53_01870 [Deltaproteobacteria bacterium]|nr:hypothetical protein [Deltaproteobacteria bacterium]